MGVIVLMAFSIGLWVVNGMALTSWTDGNILVSLSWITGVSAACYVVLCFVMDEFWGGWRTEFGGWKRSLKEAAINFVPWLVSWWALNLLLWWMRDKLSYDEGTGWMWGMLIICTAFTMMISTFSVSLWLLNRGVKKDG